MPTGETALAEPACHHPWQQMVIDCSGVVAPCCYWAGYGKTEPAVGDINKNTVMEVWNGEAYQRLRRGMAAGDLDAAGCAGCYALSQGLGAALRYDPDADEEHPVHSDYAKNLQVLRREVAAGASVLQAKPTVISLTPSHQCNIRCIHCYQDGMRSVRLERPEAVEEVLSLTPVLVRIVAGGGEPFIMKLWQTFLSEFRQEQNPYLEFATSTNATVLTEEMEQGLRKFKTLEIIVSLDGVGDVFEKVRVGAKFDCVVENVKKLQTIVRESASPRSSGGLCMSVMKSNIRNMADVVRFAAEEELTIALAPVTAFPAQESLACFNDMPTETQGWREAYIEARSAVDGELIPMLARLWRSDEAAVESLRRFWRSNFDLLERQCPWHLLDREHHRVRVELPRRVMHGWRDCVGTKYPLIAYIRRQEEPCAPAPHYARVDQTGFEVSLPEDSYGVSFSAEWAPCPTPPALRLTVDSGGRTTTSVPCREQLRTRIHCARKWLRRLTRREEPAEET